MLVEWGLDTRCGNCMGLPLVLGVAGCLYIRCRWFICCVLVCALGGAGSSSKSLNWSLSVIIFKTEIILAQGLKTSHKEL